MKVNNLKDKTPTEIADNLQNVDNISMIPQQITAQAYILAALNRELIDSQREYQEKSIKQMKHLVYATWILVIATIFAPIIVPIGNSFITWLKNLIGATSTTIW